MTRWAILAVSAATLLGCGNAASGGKSHTDATPSNAGGTSSNGSGTSSSGGASSTADGATSQETSSSSGNATSSGGGASSSSEASSGGGTSGSGGSGGATLDGDTIKSCETYCMTDADCCADFGFGDECPDRFPGRVVCQNDPELGWDHVCRPLTAGCVDDAECQAVNPLLICVEEAPQWCNVSLCPGVYTCMSPGCANDADCDTGQACVVRGRVGLCGKLCEAHADCEPYEQCQDNVYPEDPRAFCVQQPNTFPPYTDPPPPECTTDSDCAESGNGPRCHAALGRCGCAGDSDCSASERCR